MLNNFHINNIEATFESLINTDTIVKRYSHSTKQGRYSRKSITEVERINLTDMKAMIVLIRLHSIVFTGDLIEDLNAGGSITQNRKNEFEIGDPANDEAMLQK